jgi:hypothetical protein
MKRTTLICCLITAAFAADAQQGQLEVSGVDETGSVGKVRYYDPAAVGQKKAPLLNMGDIEGTPFWDEHWNPGYLTLRNGSTIKLSEVKVNQYSHEVHYLDGSSEMSADGMQVRKVVLMKAKDTAHVLARFESLPDMDASNKISFYRVANEGRFRLLELQKATVKTSAYDPSLGKAENRWITKSRYVLADKDILQPIGDLDKEKILAIAKSDADTEAWLKSNKNKLKNEADVVAFLNYLNKK